MFTVIMISLLSCSLIFHHKNGNKRHKKMDNCVLMLDFFEKYWAYDTISKVYYIEDVFRTNPKYQNVVFDTLFYQCIQCCIGKTPKEIVGVWGKPLSCNKDSTQLTYYFYLDKSKSKKYSEGCMLKIDSPFEAKIDYIETTYGDNIVYTFVNKKYKQTKKK